MLDSVLGGLFDIEWLYVLKDGVIFGLLLLKSLDLVFYYGILCALYVRKGLMIGLCVLPVIVIEANLQSPPHLQPWNLAQSQNLPSPRIRGVKMFAIFSQNSEIQLAVYARKILLASVATDFFDLRVSSYRAPHLSLRGDKTKIFRMYRKRKCEMKHKIKFVDRRKVHELLLYVWRNG